MKRLPAKPRNRNAEPTNEDRAQWALRALQQFANDTEGGELDCALRDLLADLMHLGNCGRLRDSAGNEIGFEDELERARNFFAEELFLETKTTTGGKP